MLVGTWDWKHFFTVFLTLFAVIDIIGSIPLLIHLKSKSEAKLNVLKATIFSGSIMILFLFFGSSFLNLLSLDANSFALAGAIIIFFLGLEMILGIEFFKTDGKETSNQQTFFPVAFPIITGAGTLATIISIKDSYPSFILLSAILANLIVIFLVLKSLKTIKRIMGKNGLLALRKFFGVILISIAIKIFLQNLQILIE